jgi:hypothetical protein
MAPGLLAEADDVKAEADDVKAEADDVIEWEIVKGGTG